MHTNNQILQYEFKPRIIVWQLTTRDDTCPNRSELLDQHECLLIIDSIARLAKPIVILTGRHIVERPDLSEIVDYGSALGLKVIIELLPEEITDEIIERFQGYGSRIFRIIINDLIIEDIDNRYKQTESFLNLERAIQRLKDKSFEIHFSYTITQPDIRKLSFNLDYAFRTAARGLYCHLRFDKTVPEISIFDDEVQSLDEFIGKISEMKTLVPNDMYLSPQCVRYTPFPDEQVDLDFSAVRHPRWIHQCLAGKTFAFIDGIGRVFVCSGMCKECGNLREVNYDFKCIWMDSEIMNNLRKYTRSCVQTRLLFKRQKEFSTYKDQIINENIEW